MGISKKIDSMISNSSWIRKMFEEGTRLKTKHGAENVCDFSLGNPNLPPPEMFNNALEEIILDPCDHRYMPNNGYPFVRKEVARFLSVEQGVTIGEDDVVMTCGAAGALNVIFKTILDHGDEVITPAPFFAEYQFYADNHGGRLKTVPTNRDFTLNIEAISSAINEKTKAVLINSPNNPTGRIYSEGSIKELAGVLKKIGRKMNKKLYLISDEPYRKIVFDGLKVPGIFQCCNDSIIATSYSKDISIPGERIGFIAINPKAACNKKLSEGMSFANRILGFVNAPAIMQRAISKIQGLSVDVSAYERKRDLLCEGLADCGYDFIKPEGAFYLFPKAPGEDDVRFTRSLQEELILVVPGSGFGGPGHFRIAFCVEDETIIQAIPRFRRVINKFQTLC